jgi:hypothetical protein
MLPCTLRCMSRCCLHPNIIGPHGLTTLIAWPSCSVFQQAVARQLLSQHRLQSTRKIVWVENVIIIMTGLE